jgi:uncharacterized protein YdcH (DUF465 family)
MSIMRHFDRLCAIRDQLEDRLELHEARDCFGSDDIEDGTRLDLRQRIAQMADEISSLMHNPRYSDI